MISSVTSLDELRDMLSYSRWDEIKKRRPGQTDKERAVVEQDLALGELIHELRTSAGLSQRKLAERMDTAQSVISRAATW